MSTTVLLIVLAACAAAVLGGLTYFGLRAYRLFRTGARVAKSISTQAAKLSERAATAQAKAAALAESSGKVAAGAAALQHSLARLGVITAAITEARGPWLSIRRFFKEK
jgi:hypothetical protein